MLLNWFYYASIVLDAKAQIVVSEHMLTYSDGNT